MATTSRRSFLIRSGLAASSLGLGHSAFAQDTEPSSRPNVVMILVDDMGYGDLGCTDAPDIRTPYIDSLARDGVFLTQAYTSAPVCTPTRCALMTGRYQARCPNLEWALHASVRTTGLQSDQTTIATMLRDSGYRTALFGKWHLGARPEWGPNAHGFDEFYGLLSGNVDHFTFEESTGDPDLFENTTPVEPSGYSTDVITQRSVDFISRNQDEPFFLYVSYNAPHWPIQGPEDEERPFERWAAGDRETYAEMVESIDDGVGTILTVLQEAGLDENTLVIFSSDNGGDRFSRNAPFSGRKGTLEEGGIRVPLLMRWPARLAAGVRNPQMTITMDISATILSAAEVKPTRPLEGIDLFPYLTGQRNPIEQTFVWRSDFRNEKAVRWGKWKWRSKDGAETLHNLDEDIAEANDVSDEFIDIVYWMHDIYRQWEEAMPYRQTIFGNDMHGMSSPSEGALLR